MTNWIRKCSMTVGGMTFVGGTREQTLRMRFHVEQRTTQGPGIADIFITNPATQTAQAIKALPEFTPVSLSAGYEEGEFGEIFKGYLKQVRVGKDSPVDTYVHVRAADDLAYNWAVVNKTLPAGSTGMDLFNALTQAMSKLGVTVATAPNDALAAIKYPRGLSLFSPVKELMRTLSHSVNSTWSIVNGQLMMVPINGSYGGPWQTNVMTGMVGMPVSTSTGVIVRMLINPNVRVNSLLQINNADIQEAVQSYSFDGSAEVANFKLPPPDADGIYRVLHVSYDADSRGGPWYLDCTCLSNSNPGAGSLQTRQNADIAAPHTYLGQD